MKKSKNKCHNSTPVLRLTEVRANYYKPDWLNVEKTHFVNAKTANYA